MRVRLPLHQNAAASADHAGFKAEADPRDHATTPQNRNFMGKPGDPNAGRPNQPWARRSERAPGPHPADERSSAAVRQTTLPQSQPRGRECRDH